MDIDIRIKSKDKELETLKGAAIFLTEKLSKLKGVSDIRDNLPMGKREISFQLTEKQSIGFNSNSFCKKIKATLEGVSLTKFFRERRKRNRRSKPKVLILSNILILIYYYLLNKPCSFIRDC